MCGFKPGDEVVCVRQGRSLDDPTAVGETYVVERVWLHPDTGGVAIDLVGIENGDPEGRSGFWGHCPDRFRKVERKTDKLSLTEWLSQPSGDTDKLDKTRAPAKRRERA